MWWWNFQPYGGKHTLCQSSSALDLCFNLFLEEEKKSFWMRVSDLNTDFGSHHASLEVWKCCWTSFVQSALPIFQETKILSWDGHFTTKIAVVFWRSFSISCSRYILHINSSLKIQQVWTLGRLFWSFILLDDCNAISSATLKQIWSTQYIWPDKKEGQVVSDWEMIFSKVGKYGWLIFTWERMCRAVF